MEKDSWDSDIIIFQRLAGPNIFYCKNFFLQLKVQMTNWKRFQILYFLWNISIKFHWDFSKTVLLWLEKNEYLMIRNARVAICTIIIILIGPFCGNSTFWFKWEMIFGTLFAIEFCDVDAFLEKRGKSLDLADAHTVNHVPLSFY